MRYYILFYSILSLSFSSCNLEENSHYIDEEADYNTPYVDTSIFESNYSNISYTTIQIGSLHYNVLKYNVFPKDLSLRPYFNWPILTSTNLGTVLVACTNLQRFGTDCEMDIVLARKEKESEIWEIKKIYQTDTKKGRVMCPAFVIDKTTGRIYLFANYFKKIYAEAEDHTTDEVEHVYKYSDDDGRTWSIEFSLKHSWNSIIDNYNNGFSLFSSTQSESSEYNSLWYKDYGKCPNLHITNDNLICLTCGPNGISLDNGMLIVPSCVIIDRVWRSALMIRENGKWRYSRPTPNPGDSECTVYIDNENRIVLDCRTKTTQRRKYLYNMKRDEYTETNSSIIGSYVQVSAEIINDDGLFYMCYPESPNNERKNLTFYGSKDGINWKKIFLINSSSSSIYGYSSITHNKNMLMISYETPDGIIMMDISSCRDAIRQNILND
jgi:hypothetical protein